MGENGTYPSFCRLDKVYEILKHFKLNKDIWKKTDATYHRSKTGGGEWEKQKKIPDSWQIHYKDLTFNLKFIAGSFNSLIN